MESKTIIAPGITINGNLTGEGDVEVHGKVSGDIKTNGAINVTESGVIEGHIECGKATIGGFMRGKVNATDSVDIGGFIEGDVKTARLNITGAGAMQGNVEMPMSDAARSRSGASMSATARLSPPKVTTTPAAPTQPGATSAA